MKRLFLIDLENVGRRFMQGLSELTPQDSVELFHAEVYGNEVPNDILYEIKKFTQNVEISSMKAHTKNAMDFQLCTFLGYQVAKWGQSVNYYIVSEDKGYLAATEFIKKTLHEPINISMIASFQELKDAADMKTSVSEILDIYPKKIQKIAANEFASCSTLLEYHNALQKLLPRDAAQIYAMTKAAFQSQKRCSL